MRGLRAGVRVGGEPGPAGNKRPRPQRPPKPERAVTARSRPQSPRLKPRGRPQDSGRARSGGVGLRTAEEPDADLPQPQPGLRGPCPTPRSTSLRGRRGGHRPLLTGRPVGGAGTTSRGPPAPRPLSSRGGVLRAAPAAAGYSGSGATYKSSLCGAILSLSVCSGRVSPVRGAGSEGRRRRRQVRRAAPSPPRRPRGPRTGRLQRREEPVP